MVISFFSTPHAAQIHYLKFRFFSSSTSLVRIPRDETVIAKVGKKKGPVKKKGLEIHSSPEF